MRNGDKPHNPAGVKVHLGPGYRINKKTGRVEKVKGFGLDNLSEDPTEEIQARSRHEER